MDPQPITLPPRPKAAQPEPERPENFHAFVDSIRELLASVRARLEQHGEDSEGASWWLQFHRAPCVYRITSDRRTELMQLERSLGSFVPNSQPGWRMLDSRPQPEPDFDIAFKLVKEMLGRFGQP